MWPGHLPVIYRISRSGLLSSRNLPPQRVTDRLLRDPIDRQPQLFASTASYS